MEKYINEYIRPRLQGDGGEITFVEEKGDEVTVLLQGECRRMLSVKLLRAAGMQPDSIAQKIGAPPFAVRQLSQTVAQYTEEQLKRMTDVCMDTE